MDTSHTHDPTELLKLIDYLQEKVKASEQQFANDKKALLEAKKKIIEQEFSKYRILFYLSAGSSDPKITKYLLHIEEAVENLPDLQKQIIMKRYMDIDADYKSDYQTYQSMGISEGTFSKRRNLAIEKLLISLYKKESK